MSIFWVRKLRVERLNFMSILGSEYKSSGFCFSELTITPHCFFLGDAQSVKSITKLQKLLFSSWMTGGGRQGIKAYRTPMNKSSFLKVPLGKGKVNYSRKLLANLIGEFFSNSNQKRLRDRWMDGWMGSFRILPRNPHYLF